MAFVRHGTLTANTVTAVTLPSRTTPTNPGSAATVEIANVDGASPIYFRVLSATDNTAGVTVAVAGNDCEVLPATINAMRIPLPTEGGDPYVAKLISAGTPKYSVRAE